MIEVDNLSLSFGRHRVIEAVSITVTPGELVAIVGANGCGKSTLLRAVASELAPFAGSIRLGGRELSTWTALERAQLRAVLPQMSALAFPFPVLDVVRLGRAPHRSARSTNDDIVEAALAEVDGLILAYRSYTSLSGGEKQRVQLARVLAQVWQPAIAGERYLLLDEPTNHLDIGQQHTVLRAMRRRAQAGVGVLAVLHDLNLAAEYADRLILLERGRVLSAGTAAAVLRPATIERAFGVPVTVLNHPHHHGPLVIGAPAEEETRS